jgi:predicted pyridoxine 5'-phosphate oxidase superfamily flavin-nucleotide-binding protein
MSTPTLDTIRNCLEGFVPAMIATCDEEGTPNVALLSQVHYVDPEHVALSYQFFNKTRHNVLKTKTASVRLTDPVTVAMYRLGLKYEQTQTNGPLFGIDEGETRGDRFA